MPYKHLFFDLDHTLWDFEANSRQTLEELYHAHDLFNRGVADFDQFHKNYLVHNDKLWARYRNGFIKVDERPEEVTDMERSIRGEVIASTFDEPAEKHVKVSTIALQKAKRLVECGHDVIILLDSITRLARAHNTVAPSSGKVLSGGVEANAMQKPKQFFGAARKIEDGGSLTIIATALVDTGSKMDEVIFEEFKGTGNMELQLDRRLANKRVYPAIDLVASSTRRDDLLLDRDVLQRMNLLRVYLTDMNAEEAMRELQNRMKGTKNNEEFLASMNR